MGCHTIDPITNIRFLQFNINNFRITVNPLFRFGLVESCLENSIYYMMIIIQISYKNQKLTICN